MIVFMDINDLRMQAALAQTSRDLAKQLSNSKFMQSIHYHKIQNIEKKEIKQKPLIKTQNCSNIVKKSTQEILEAMDEIHK